MALRDRSLQGDARALALAAEVRRLQPSAQDLAREIEAPRSPIPASDLCSIGRVLLVLLGGDLDSGDAGCSGSSAT